MDMYNTTYRQAEAHAAVGDIYDILYSRDSIAVSSSRIQSTGGSSLSSSRHKRDNALQQ